MTDPIPASIYGKRATDVVIAEAQGLVWFRSPKGLRFIVPRGWVDDDGASGISRSYLPADGTEPLAWGWDDRLPRCSTDNNLAMVLFAELPHALLGNPGWPEGINQWACIFGPEGDGECHYAATAALAIGAAWLAWKRAENSKILRADT